MAFNLKRKRIFAGTSRRSKRGKFTRKRRFTKGRRNAFQTSYQGMGVVPYRARKVGLKRWRNHLYRSTLTNTHYKSYGTQVASQTTGTTAGQGAVVIRNAEASSTVATSFWLAANGATTPDQGGTVPTFNSDIILRGGKIGLTASVADDNTDAVLVRVWLIFANDDPDDGVIVTPQSIAWTPADWPDFPTRMGSIVAYRQAYLKYNQPMMSFEHRVRPRKIDRKVHEQGGKCYRWLIHTCNLTSATDVTVNTYKTWNLSFTGDAVT